MHSNLIDSRYNRKQGRLAKKAGIQRSILSRFLKGGALEVGSAIKLYEHENKHYLLGDGSYGARTRRTNFLALLEQAGFGEWSRIEKMWEVRDILAGVLGAERVLVSAEGFNAVGSNARESEHPKL